MGRYIKSSIDVRVVTVTIHTVAREDTNSIFMDESGSCVILC
jgi:hypothetical protein